ncbi:Hpt domain-containing protein [Polaribacter sp.]|nr:Hpt domain-containing protein [Polaribacter sp.]
MEVPNLNYINSLAGDDKEFKEQLISILKSEFPLEEKLLQENIKKRQYILAAGNVHKIKHKIGMLGLEHDFNLASLLEEDLKNDSLENLDEFLVCLQKISNFIENI